MSKGHGFCHLFGWLEVLWAHFLVSSAFWIIEVTSKEHYQLSKVLLH